MQGRMSSQADTEESFAELFPRAHTAIRQGIANGLHRGCQIYVSHDNSPLADVGIGEAAPDVAMTGDTVNLWRSAGKPMTAAAVLRVMEDRRLSLDDAVAQHVPEFRHDEVRIIDLLTHTSGLPNEDVGWPDASWEEIVSNICDLQQNRDLGAAYSYVANWFLLGEILLNSDAESSSFANKIQSAVFGELNMSDSWNGMPPSVWQQNQERIAEVETVLASGRRRRERLHEKEHCAAASPGSNLRCTARDVGRFYEALESADLFRSRETLQLMTRPHRDATKDATFRAEVRMGLGVLLAPGRQGIPYGFGDYCSPNTYGHGGAQCAMAFCDPAYKLIVAWAVNGLPGEPKHQERNRAINSAVYQDLLDLN